MVNTGNLPRDPRCSSCTLPGRWQIDKQVLPILKYYPAHPAQILPQEHVPPAVNTGNLPRDPRCSSCTPPGRRPPRWQIDKKVLPILKYYPTHTAQILPQEHVPPVVNTAKPTA